MGKPVTRRGLRERDRTAVRQYYAQDESLRDYLIVHSLLARCSNLIEATEPHKQLWLQGIHKPGRSFGSKIPSYVNLPEAFSPARPLPFITIQSFVITALNQLTVSTVRVLACQRVISESYLRDPGDRNLLSQSLLFRNVNRKRQWW